MKWYKYTQNNSGGYYDVNDKVSKWVFIERELESQADEFFSRLTCDASPDCACCGARWYGLDDELEFPFVEFVDVYTYKPDYKQEWERLYANLTKVGNEIKDSKFKYYGYKVQFNTASEYARYLKNRWGEHSGKHDCVLHYNEGHIEYV